MADDKTISTNNSSNTWTWTNQIKTSATTWQQYTKNFWVIPGTIQEQRFAICRSCEHLAALQICKLCKCVMPLKVKMAESSCPVNKWSEIKRPPPDSL